MLHWNWKEFIKKEAVLLVSGLLAVLSMFFVKPSIKYVEYIDYRVLVILYSLMLVVKGLQKIGVFEALGNGLLNNIKEVRQLSIVLIGLCFITSMFITNDVALITFVPFTVMILEAASLKERIASTIILQTIAANLGSMLTPIGNPQNLYLYSQSGMGAAEFIKIMFPLCVVSLSLLLLMISVQKKAEIKVEYLENEGAIMPRRLVLYGGLFLLCLATVLHWISFAVILPIVIVMVFIDDKSIIKTVDYGLLFTFVFFFIFIGNLGEMPSVQSLLSQIVEGKEMETGILLSQFISNVPAAILLSKFTVHYKMLLWGVNIGGLGTLVASLASLISYKYYVASSEANQKKYLLQFTGMNMFFLLILYGAAKAVTIL